MDSTELLDQFRRDVVDIEEPQLWSDDEVFSYIDDAQKQLCRHVGGIADASSPMTVLPYDAGQDWLKQDDRILKVRTAYQVSDGREIVLINFEDMPTHSLRFDGRTGTPKFLVLGIEEHKARLYPTPVVADTVQLHIDRMPLKKIDDSDQLLEVSDRHFRGLLLRVKALAYTKQDAETLDRDKAQRFDGEFAAYCEQARKEKERAKHKTRVVAYGGI